MRIEQLPFELTVCKVSSMADIDLQCDFFFVGKTDDELSYVCDTNSVPDGTLAREDGWRAFRIQGTLDFSLVGVLSRISSVLADAGIGLFAVSTYDTDYILVKSESFDSALSVLAVAGYEIV